MTGCVRSLAPAFVSGVCCAVLTSLLLSYHGNQLESAAQQGDCTVRRPTEPVETTGPVAELTHQRRRVRIFCWLMVPYMMPIYHMILINGSWGRRCDDYAFVAPRASVGALDLPVLDVKLLKTMDSSDFHKVEWQRIWQSGWQLRSNGTADKFDYFLLARTGSYIIVENLRHLLHSEDPTEATMFGRRMQLAPSPGDSTTTADYLAADAGIVLSRAALDTLVRQGFSGTSSNRTVRRYCSYDSVSRAYDIQLSQCLLSLGVTIKDSRDGEGRERFHPVHPADLIEDSRMPAWLRNGSYHKPVNACLSCPSPYSVSFYGITELHKTDAMIYHVRPETVE